MKRKLKDPKKMGEKKEQAVNDSGKNQETTTRWNRKEFACNIMERLVVGSEANESVCKLRKIIDKSFILIIRRNTLTLQKILLNIIGEILD